MLKKFWIGKDLNKYFAGFPAKANECTVIKLSGDIGMETRKIIHVDMDAFYAAVEQRDRPELKGRPVVVGGSPQSRGVVSTASYEARKFGIHSAMPLAEAYRRCPSAVFLPVDGAKYKAVSKQIHKIFTGYTPLVEPLSLDEAFLDVSGSTLLFGSAPSIAREIKARIAAELDLTASVGVAGNKFLAKLASDLRKPNGIVIVDPDRVQEFLDPLSVERVWGVGIKTAQRLHGLNIKTVRDLRSLEEERLAGLFGSLGSQLYLLARGIDDRPVESGREAKSIGREITFDADIRERQALETILLKLAVSVARRLRQEALKARTVSLKIRYHDFRTVTRARTLAALTDLDQDIYQAACDLLREISLRDPVRLAGISLHNLSDQDDAQLSLFGERSEEKERLTRAIDAVKDKFGERSITRARLLKPKDK